ncbi:ATP-binding cassette domain-containing protein, partial [Staphylococcus haemolyticus]
MLEFKNISKNYRKKAILENINFKICKGEKVGLLGTVGAGKTTLMKLIAKSQLPTQGHIFYNGIDINSKDNVLNDFAFMINQIYFPEI